MAITPIQKRGTTILTHPSSLPAAVKSVGAVPSVLSSQRELHPLAPIHLTGDDVTPAALPRTLMQLHESIRVATLAIRQDPESAPCYVRGVRFTNTTDKSATITQTFKHQLNRPFTGLGVCRSQGAPYQGNEISNPNGLDPAQYATVQTVVPANTTAIHDFKLSGD